MANIMVASASHHGIRVRSRQRSATATLSAIASSVTAANTTSEPSTPRYPPNSPISSEMGRDWKSASIGRSPRAAKSTAMYMSPWNGENGAKNFGYTNCSVSTYPANASAQSASVRKVKDQRSLANCPAVRCIERRSLTRERANPSERNRSVARCETRYGLSKGLALASKPGAPNGGEQEREVLVARAMVDDARAQRGAVRDARRADDRRAAFLDVDRDLRVEPVELIGGEAGDAIAKADDVERDGREQLQIRIGRDGSTQRRRQAARACDRRAEALDAG